jgi:PD-(D/E)XK nuclease superfamily
MQKILSIDATVLNSVQSCARKTEYSFIQNIRPPDKGESLEKGDLMHKMLEVYYSLLGSCARLDSEVFLELHKAGLTTPLVHNFPTIVRYATETGRYFATKLNLPIDVSEETIYQFNEYAKYYENDSWRPLAVEEVGSKILYEDADLQIIYNCKTDLVAQQVNIIAPFDHKTSKRRENPTSLSNQFIGTCYVLGFNNIVINKIGFQKTLKANERFQRYILTIDEERIKEWRENTILWCKVLVNYQEKNNWPMNLTSCDKYSGCIYAPICESSPEGRPWKIERDYKKEKEWDVASILEAK